MARRTVFTDSGFWKYSGPFSNVSDRIMPKSDAVSSRPEHHGHPTKVFGLVPYTEISPVSLNLLMMLCAVDDEIGKALQFDDEERCFKVLHIFLRTLSQIGEPRPIFTIMLQT